MGFYLKNIPFIQFHLINWKTVKILVPLHRWKEGCTVYIHPGLCTLSISEGCTASRGVYTVHPDLPSVLWFYPTAFICNHSNLMVAVHNYCTPLYEYLMSCTPLHEYLIRLYTLLDLLMYSWRGVQKYIQGKRTN